MWRRFCWFRLVVLFIVIAALSAKLPAQTNSPKKVALLVGVNRYEKRGFSDRPLEYAERDVDELAAELKKQGFEVRLLKGSLSESKRATKKNIQSTLDQLLDDRTSRDIVFLGFAGHGQQLPLYDEKGNVQTTPGGKPLEDAYYCPVDAVKGEPSSLISLTNLVQTLDRKGGINLVMVDACRDNPDPGRGVRSITGNELNGRLPANTAMVFSCAAGQQALETKDAGGGHGVFFYHVIEGLRGEAKNARGEITWNTLVTYVTDNVNPKAKEWFPDQGKIADIDREGLLQTPHELRNLTRVPVLARIERPNPKPVPEPESLLTNSLGMKLRLIPAGSFQMGGDKTPEELVKLFEGTKVENYADEQPQHPVKITKPYYLGIYEVTVAQFRQFVEATDYKTEAEQDGKGGWGFNSGEGKFEQSPNFSWRNPGFEQGDLHPVVNVSWNDAVAFCKWLSKKEEREYRLPTEAEWEYACRGKTTTMYQHGNDPEGLASVGNVRYATFLAHPFGAIGGEIKAKDGYEFTAPVGSFRSNGFGLYDLHGNVWEWCSDWYGSDYYKTSSREDPTGPNDGSYRVLRGGSWGYGAGYCRSAARDGDAPDYRLINLGFRLALGPSGQ